LEPFKTSTDLPTNEYGASTLKKSKTNAETSAFVIIPGRCVDPEVNMPCLMPLPATITGGKKSGGFNPFGKKDGGAQKK
jgi:hypothetical protein